MKHLMISTRTDQSNWSRTRLIRDSETVRMSSSDSAFPTLWFAGSSNCHQSLRFWVRAAARMAIHVAFIALCLACVSAWAQGPAGTPLLDPELQAGLDSHKAGRFKEAVDIYSEAIKKNPRSVEAYDWRGMAYDELNELDKALADYNEAIKLAPEYADAYNNRGEVFRKKKMYREATGDYRKALQLDSSFAEAHYNMALVLEVEKKNNTAATELEKYLELKRDAPDKAAVLEKIKSLKAAAATPPPATPAPPAPGVAPAPPAPGTAPAPPKAGPPVAPGVKAPTPPGPPPLKAGPPKPVPGTAPMPGMDQLPISQESVAAIIGLVMGLGILALILPIALYIFFAVMLFLIAQKTNTSSAWLAFIPIANVFLMVRIAGKPIWWIVLLFLPAISPAIGFLGSVDPTDGIIVMALTVLVSLVCLAAWLFVDLGIADARGKSVIWGVLLFIPCTNPIALAYLGLSKR